MSCNVKHGNGLVEAHWQLVNVNVDDDQRYTKTTVTKIPTGVTRTYSAIFSHYTIY